MRKAGLEHVQTVGQKKRVVQGRFFQKLADEVPAERGPVIRFEPRPSPFQSCIQTQIHGFEFFSGEALILVPVIRGAAKRQPADGLE